MSDEVCDIGPSKAWPRGPESEPDPDWEGLDEDEQEAKMLASYLKDGATCLSYDPSRSSS